MKIYGLKQAFAVCAILVALVYLLIFAALKIIPTPEDVVFSDIDQAYIDAEQLMDKIKSRSTDPFYSELLMRIHLPEALQIDRVKSAEIFFDHVSLIMHTHTEVTLGTRLWREGAVPPKNDKPTAYSRVTFFSVFKDLGISSDNRF